MTNATSMSATAITARSVSSSATVVCSVVSHGWGKHEKLPDGSLQQPGQPPVGQRFAAGLAGRAVLKRLVRERHLAHGIAAHWARHPGTRVYPQARALLALQPGGLLADRAVHRVGEHALQRLM